MVLPLMKGGDSGVYVCSVVPATNISDVYQMKVTATGEILRHIQHMSKHRNRVSRNK